MEKKKEVSCHLSAGSFICVVSLSGSCGISGNVRLRRCKYCYILAILVTGSFGNRKFDCGSGSQK